MIWFLFQITLDADEVFMKEIVPKSHRNLAAALDLCTCPSGKVFAAVSCSSNENCP